MKQKLFTQCGLLRLTDGGKSRLFKVRNNYDVTSFELEPLAFLPEPQTVIEVYPQANLIMTQDTLFTLDGKIVLHNDRDKISVIPINSLETNKWMILQDSMHDNDTRYRLTFWDGATEYDYIWGRYLLKSDKYFATYTSGDRRWCVYAYDGKLILDVENESADMKICGDFFIAQSIGNHSSYSLKQLSTGKAEKRRVFKQQQLIMCSTNQDFAIGANLQGIAQTYYQGIYREYGKVEMIELYDKAGLFTVKRNGKYFLYHYNGEVFATNICPCGADYVAYDETNNTVLIGVNGVFRLITV